MQQRAPTTMELLEEKLRNFKERFAQHFYDMGYTTEKIVEFTAVNLIAELMPVQMYWAMIETCNTDFFLALAAAKPPPPGLTDAQINDWCKRQQIIINHVKHLSPDDLAVGWRYANFFLKCVRDLTSKKP
jgi:hypothetical protein